MILVMSLLVTGVFFARLVAWGLPSDHSPRSLVVSDDAEARRYRETNAIFGDDRVVVVALETEDVFTPAVIQQIRDLTNGLTAVPGVKHVVSLTNVQKARESGDEVRVGRLIPLKADAAELRRIGDETLSDGLLTGQVVARDRKMAAIDIFLDTGQGVSGEKVIGRVREITAQHSTPAKIYFAGLPYMEFRNGQHIRRDLGALAPVTILLILVTFFITFRSLRGVILPLVTVAVGLIWTFGAMSFAGRPFTVVTMMVPVIIMAIGSSYVIHVINQYYIACVAAGHPGTERRTALVQNALEFITPAVLVSGSTTMAGFGSLIFTDITGSHDMGLFSATGCAATTLLSLTMVPAWLALLPMPETRAGESPIMTARGVGTLLRVLGTLVTERRAIIYGVTMVALVFGISGAFHLRIDSDLMNFYPKNSEERIGADKLQEHLGGAASFQVIVEGPSADSLHRVESLRTIEQLETFIRGLPGVDRTFSVTDLLKALGGLGGTTAGDPRAIPSDQATIDLFLNKYLAEGSGDVPIRLISPDGRKAQIIVQSHLFGSREMGRALDQIDQWGRENLPLGYSLYSTGIFVLLNRTSDSVAADQVRSLAIALALIFLMMAALFLSLRLGIIALIPNLVPIVFFFGFMGWTGISLNLNTSLVASVVLGLAVDNAAHLVRRYNALRESVSTWQEAVRESLILTGRPMIFANATLAFAFAVFALSSFLPMRTGGLLSGVTILACLFADLTLLPVLLTARYSSKTSRKSMDRAA